MAAKNASGFLKTLLLTFLTRPNAHLTPCSILTPEPESCLLSVGDWGLVMLQIPPT